MNLDRPPPPKKKRETSPPLSMLLTPSLTLATQTNLSVLSYQKLPKPNFQKFTQDQDKQNIGNGEFTKIFELLLLLFFFLLFVALALQCGQWLLSQSVSLTQYMVLSVCLFQLAPEWSCDVEARRRTDYCPLGPFLTLLEVSVEFRCC